MNEEIERILNMINIDDKLLFDMTEYKKETIADFRYGNWENAWMILRKSVFWMN
jgi:hypothetical protein